jgi:hypothetical protein
LAKEQAQFQGLVPEIGQVPETTVEKVIDDSALAGSDDGSLASAERRKALDSLATAKRVQDRPKSSSVGGLWGLVCLLAGFTLVLAFRQVANRVVPPGNPPKMPGW